MSTKAKRHPHKYYRAKTPFGYVWACALSDCSHYMPRHMEMLLPGKNTVCWKCDEITTMDSRTMAMEKPLCIDCDDRVISPSNLNVEQLAEIIKGIKE